MSARITFPRITKSFFHGKVVVRTRRTHRRLHIAYRTASNKRVSTFRLAVAYRVLIVSIKHYPTH